MAFSSDGKARVPPAPLYSLAGCDLGRLFDSPEGLRTIVTAVLKAGTGEKCGVAARGRAAKPDIGGGDFLARLGFFRFFDSLCPYKPSVGAFVGENRIGHVR